MGSVDGWPLAISPFQIPGGTAGTGSVQATCRACWPPLGAVCYSPEARPFGVPPVPVADLALGKFSGGNKDGSRDVAGTPAAPCWEPGVFHPCRDIYLLRSSRLGGSAGPLRGLASGSYLVDSASSHMLVSKIKPCMSKYKHSCTVKLRMAH